MIYLIRHGQAETNLKTGQKELTPEGKKNAINLAIKLKERNISIKKYLHSDLLRAKQTAQIVAGSVPAPLEEVNYLSPNEDPHHLYHMIDELNGHAIVGHLPYLNLISSLLTTGTIDKEPASFAPTTICAFENVNGKWKLAWRDDPPH